MPTSRRTPCSSAPRRASRGRRKQIENYRDYKATDFDLAFAQWMHGINRGVLLPPGLDEQWLISVMHSESDAMHYAEVFAEFVAELGLAESLVSAVEVGQPQRRSSR